MACLVLVLGWSVAAPRLAAQQSGNGAHVSGVVRTAAGAPVGGVAVQLAGTSYRGTTSESGTFDLVAVAPGTYTLVARGPARAGARVRVTVVAGKDTKVDLVMVAAGAAPTSASGAETLAEVKVEGQRAETAPSGPGVSDAGSNEYSVTAANIANLPVGTNTAITDVLTQMPGVAIDQNQQIHIRNTEGPQFQYQINGVVVPFDINTNPPFLSMINPMFVKQLDLLDGVLPSRYSYATGGVVDIQTKDGCEQPGRRVSPSSAASAATLQPSAQYGGCDGKFSYYVSGLYDQGETAFSSATPGAEPDPRLHQPGPGLRLLLLRSDQRPQLSLILSSGRQQQPAAQCRRPRPRQFTLAGVSTLQLGDINSVSELPRLPRHADPERRSDPTT